MHTFEPRGKRRPLAAAVALLFVLLGLAAGHAHAACDPPVVQPAGPWGRPPVAVPRIGPADSGMAPFTIELDGSASYDPDGKIATYQWQIIPTGFVADHKKARYTFQTGGTYLARLRVWDQRGLMGETNCHVVVEPNRNPPTVSLSHETISNQPLSLRFQADAQDVDGRITGYSWWFGEDAMGSSGGPRETYTYSRPGRYLVRVMVWDEQGLSSQAEETVEVQLPPNEPPVAKLTAQPRRVEVHEPVTFNGSSSYDPEKQTLTWSWSFGDGETLAGPSVVSHAFFYPGVYTVRMTVQDPLGGTTYESADIEVFQRNEPPFAAADASPLETTFPNPIQFISRSSDAEGELVRETWRFDDGATAEGRIVSHEFATPGWHTARLTVEDSHGVTRNASVRVHLIAPPNNKPPRAEATVEPRHGEAPMRVSFDATGSSDRDGSIVRFHWDFGDGAEAETAQASHVYEQPGRYFAVLTVVDDDGERDTRSWGIHVESPNPPGPPAPTATIHAAPLSGSAPLTVQLDGSASTAGQGATLTSYVWDFGDGGAAAGPLASHVYSTAGTYTARLTVTDNRGATSTATTTVTANDPPVPDNRPPVAAVEATGTGGTKPYTAAFFSRAEDPDGDDIAFYSWQVSGPGMDPAVVEGEQTGSFAFTFYQAGLFQVRLLVRDEHGLWSAPATVEVTVTLPTGPNTPPTAVIEAGATQGTAPFTTAFTAVTQDPDGDDIAFYSWLIEGAGTEPVVIEGPQSGGFAYTFHRAGTYSLRLTVRDERDAWSEPAWLTVTVEPGANNPPTVAIDAGATHGTSPAHIIFSANASDPDGDEIVYYRWVTTGDRIEPEIHEGPTAGGFLRTFAYYGNYLMRLTVQDARGAWSETAELPILIEPGPNNAPWAAILFDSNGGPVPFTTAFTAVMDDPDGDRITFYSWRIEADGMEPQVVEGEQTGAFARTFYEPGVYTVRLTVQDERGLWSEPFQIQVYVSP